MADPTVDVTLNIDSIEHHKVIVYPGSTLKFCLKNLIDSCGLRHSQVMVYDITQKKEINWDINVDGVISHNLLITVRQQTSAEKRRSSDGVVTQGSSLTRVHSYDKQQTSRYNRGEDRRPRPTRPERSQTLPGRQRAFSDQIVNRPPPLPPSREHDYDDDDYDEVFKSKVSKEDLAQLPCYHGTLNSDEVERVMASQLHRPFSYLVRQSITSPGNLTVSVTHYNNHIYHFRVFKNDTRYYITEDRIFFNMKRFLDYYSSHSIPGQKVQDLKLVYPISREDAKPRLDLDAGYAQLIPKFDDIHVATPPGGHTSCAPSRHSWKALSSRPPPPLPSDSSFEPSGGSTLKSAYVDMINKRRQSSKDIYSVASEEKSMLSDLIKLLEMHERKIGGRSSTHRQKCHCGMFVDEATLINGWMMHKSDDPETNGQVYFARGTDVVWDLPQDVWRELVSKSPEKAAQVVRHTSTDA
ncbi:uncharacterized protein LOC144436861 [Glandiceps talaboti]